MTTKVEPTVEKWERELDKINLCGCNRVCLGHNDLKEKLRTLLSHSVQEAKAERDNWWIKNLDIKEGRRYSMWRNGNNIEYLDETNLYLDTKSKMDKVDNERK